MSLVASRRCHKKKGVPHQRGGKKGTCGSLLALPAKKGVGEIRESNKESRAAKPYRKRSTPKNLNREYKLKPQYLKAVVHIDAGKALPSCRMIGVQLCMFFSDGKTWEGEADPGERVAIGSSQTSLRH